MRRRDSTCCGYRGPGNIPFSKIITWAWFHLKAGHRVEFLQNPSQKTLNTKIVSRHGRSQIGPCGSYRIRRKGVKIAGSFTDQETSPRLARFVCALRCCADDWLPRPNTLPLKTWPIRIPSRPEDVVGGVEKM